ncbi:hypothetical protein R3W88_010866 [Solanum pinnatisectum]|uniref:MATH domain-containing protein n=1 Tax=Solanum pinnatisectum TaxID=50273 RepID=A0AAV9L591_9SOLN|nr:hypothetical protein R3W88_010866 [Solanum pinnatisectum]
MEKSIDASPTRYLLKIESFSLLSENGTSKYESLLTTLSVSFYCFYFFLKDRVEKMIIHPDGYRDGAGHISVYLAIIGKSSLHAVWEVNVSFNFLIFDQIHDNYNVMKGIVFSFTL